MLIRHCTWALLASIAAFGCGGGTDTTPKGEGGKGGAGTTSSTTTTTSSGTGGATTTSSTTSATGGSGGSIPTNGCKPTNDTIFALDRLYFGDSDWNDLKDPEAWKNFGLDIDGITSMGTATGVCQPSNGASAATVHLDGPNGLDNAFGQILLPAFLKSIPNLTSQANAALVNGDFTIMVRLGDLGAAADQAAIPAKVYNGAYYFDVPKFDGTDCWPVAPESLTNPTDIDAAIGQYPASTLVANHWDSVSKGDLGLTLQIFNFQGHVTIHHARILMDLDPDHKGTQRGIISGVIDTEEFVVAIDHLMAQFDPATQCSGAFVDQINKQIRQSSDIMKDGTQDPTATCNGISIGLGFKAGTVAFGEIGEALVPVPDPCAP